MVELTIKERINDTKKLRKDMLLDKAEYISCYTECFNMGKIEAELFYQSELIKVNKALKEDINTLKRLNKLFVK